MPRLWARLDLFLDQEVVGRLKSPSHIMADVNTEQRPDLIHVLLRRRTGDNQIESK